MFQNPKFKSSLNLIQSAENLTSNKFGRHAKDSFQELNFLNKNNRKTGLQNPKLSGIGKNTFHNDFEFKKGSIKNEMNFKMPTEDLLLHGIPWKHFDAAAYIDKTRVPKGGDKYIKNKFNQEASDDLQVDRNVPDTRSPL